MPERKLDSWVESFLEFSEGLGSPRLFCLWTALATIAGALERKVWVRTNKGVLYPNLYVFLVGPPGVGKTLVTSLSFDFLTELEDHHLAPSNVSRASLIDALNEAERRLVRPEQSPSIVSFNSLTITANELGDFLSAYDNDFMSVLTSIYDGKPYAERKRTRDLKLRMDAPQLNFLAATTPSYLNNLLPEGAWDQGFLSRTILIYSGESVVQPLWDKVQRNDKLYQLLINDLKIIGDLYGRISFSPEAAIAIDAWNKANGPPRPEHPKLTHYSTRRTSHLLKLCMIASIERSNEFIVTIEDYQRALDWLLQAEAIMPDIFKSMRAGGDGKVMDELWYFTYEMWLKKRDPIAEHRVVQFLSERVPAHNVARIIQVMVGAGLLKESIDPKLGRAYIPKPRKQ